MAQIVLTYGGVIIFIIIFTLYPLSLQLLQSVNIPKRLFCGVLALGGGTFTLTALPGTPSVQNVIGALGRGAEDAIMPLINTAAVIGFGGVVAILTITGQTHTQACKDIGVITVALPVFAALVLLAVTAVASGIYKGQSYADRDAGHSIYVNV